MENPEGCVLQRVTRHRIANLDGELLMRDEVPNSLSPAVSKRTLSTVTLRFGKICYRGAYPIKHARHFRFRNTMIDENNESGSLKRLSDGISGRLFLGRIAGKKRLKVDGRNDASHDGRRVERASSA